MTQSYCLSQNIPGHKSRLSQIIPYRISCWDYHMAGTPEKVKKAHINSLKGRQQLYVFPSEEN